MWRKEQDGESRKVGIEYVAESACEELSFN